MADNTELNAGEGGSVVRDLQEVTTGVKYPVCVQVDVTTLSDGANVLNIPVAGTLGDGLPDPVSTLRGTCLFVYNGTNWDRLRGDLTNGVRVTPPTPLQGSLLQEAIIDIESGGSTDIVLVSGTGGQTIKIYKILLSFLTGGDIKFKDETAEITPMMRFFEAGGLVLDYSGLAWFTATAGDDFILERSNNTVTISGRVWYTKQ